MPGLDPGIHQKCEWPGESPALWFVKDIFDSQRKFFLHRSFGKRRQIDVSAVDFPLEAIRNNSHALVFCDSLILLSYPQFMHRVVQ
jgi:hypothetical protein